MGRSIINMTLNQTLIEITQWNLESTSHFRPNSNTLKNPKFQPHPKAKFHINTINSTMFLLMKFRYFLAHEYHQLLTFKSCLNQAPSFWGLVESGQKPCVKAMAFIHSGCFNSVIVDTNSIIRVSNGEVETKIVMELLVVVVVGEVELGKCGIGDVELDLVSDENEP